MAHRPNPASTCFCKLCFFFFFTWGIIDIVNNVLLEHIHAHSLTHFFVAACTLKQHSWIVATETIWPIKPNIFTIWTLTEKVCWFLVAWGIAIPLVFLVVSYSSLNPSSWLLLLCKGNFPKMRTQHANLLLMVHWLSLLRTSVFLILQLVHNYNSSIYPLYHDHGFRSLPLSCCGLPSRAGMDTLPFYISGAQFRMWPLVSFHCLLLLSTGISARV